MELSLKALSLVLGCLALFSFQFSRASGSGPEKQECGNEKFYCPRDRKCYDRALRCTAARVCLDSNGNEAKCYESGRAGMYNYYKKKTPLASSSISKRRSIEEYSNHWFVEYRGFVYEYGFSYGFQELDVNDPYYKYAPGKVKVVSELVSSSSCTRDQVIQFKDKWFKLYPNYYPVANNCQDFAKAVLCKLGTKCTNTNGQDNEEVKCLKRDCPISAAMTPRMIFNWKLYTLFGPLITFAILHIN